jgi:lipoate-protein ligase A
MLLLEQTCDTPEENLAADEALLDAAESDSQPQEYLRVWEPQQSLVVVGRGSRVASEVDLSACAARGIPILRRSSGGAAIVTGPGCLMYAVILSYQKRPALRVVEHTHRCVLERLGSALSQFIPGVQRAGISDLAWNDRKCSGNSLRCRRTHLLYHGTMLYAFDLSLLDTCLALPPRQPEYRQGRAHSAFVTNLPVSAPRLRQALLKAFPPSGCLDPWPWERTRQLASSRYADPEWNFRF